MKRDVFKAKASEFIKKMMCEWFPDRPFIKGLGISLVDANINKYDAIIQMFEDENGEIDVNGLIENISSGLNEPIKIELSKYSQLLPNRTLLITKDDIRNFLC